MADNTLLNAGTGGDTIRDKDRAGIKTQVVALDVNGAGTESLSTGDATNGLDVDVTRMPATAADGAVGLPAVQQVIAGYDGTNVQAIVTDAVGRPTVNINGTVPVSGTVGVSGTVTADTELAAPAALADATANPTVTSISALSLIFNGTTWDRTRGDITNGLDVDVTRLPANATVNVAQVAGTATDVNSGVKSAGTQRVVLATDQPQLTAALKVDGSAVTQPVSGTVTANAGTGTLATSLATLPALVTGTATVGNVGLAPRTSGGLTTGVLISAATTNATSLKGAAGQLFFIQATNINAAVRYLKFYNKATAPTVGTDTPVLVFAIPGNAAGAGFIVEVTNGLAFATGIAYAITTGVANADTGAVAANEIVVNLGYA